MNTSAQSNKERILSQHIGIANEMAGSCILCYHNGERRFFALESNTFLAGNGAIKTEAPEFTTFWATELEALHYRSTHMDALLSCARLSFATHSLIKHFAPIAHAVPDRAKHVLIINRTISMTKGTLGEVHLDCQPLGYTLEDRTHYVKIRDDTRIPAGAYQILLRTEGAMHAKYLKAFPTLHQGMLWLQRVPDFELIYLHIGNTADDTSGCVLVGHDFIHQRAKLALIDSRKAYLTLYAMLAPLAHTRRLWVLIKDVPK